MPENTSLGKVYQQSGKAYSGSFPPGDDSATPLGYNLSLNTLQQAFPPAMDGGLGNTSSAAIFNHLVETNCGCLSGTPPGYGGWWPINSSPPYYDITLQNCSLGDMTNRFSNKKYYDQYPIMNYKYVPLGIPFQTNTNANVYMQGGYGDMVNRGLFKAGSDAEKLGSNYPSTNNNTDFGWSPIHVPQSASAALQLINSQSLESSEAPFVGAIACGGDANSYCYVDNQDGGGRLVPPGSGSYKLPSRDVKSNISNDNQNTCFHAFWVYPREAQFGGWSQYAFSTCMPGSTPGNENMGNPTLGLSFLITGYGFCGVLKGLGTGFTSADASTLYSSHDNTGGSWFGLNNNAWNFVGFRVSSHSNSPSESSNHFYIFNEDNVGADDWTWNSGSFVVPPSGGNSAPVTYSTTGIMVYSPKVYTGYPVPGHEYFSGSLGHHYIFDEGPSHDDGTSNTPLSNQVSHDEMHMMAVVTNSGSYNLYGDFN